MATISTVAMSVATCVIVKVFKHLWGRENMKERDKEIEQERERERKEEQRSLEANGYRKSAIQHFSHDHQLHKYYLQPGSFSIRCESCNVVSRSGWFYICLEDGCRCGVLHAVCSEPQVALGSTCRPTAAAEITTTFAHRRDHRVTEVNSNKGYQCDHCFTNGTGRRYRCTSGCQVNLHPVCAKHPTRLSTFMHPEHELELRTMKRSKRCQICCHSLKNGDKELNLRVYGCEECKFWVHPTCSQLPQYILHKLHPQHTLQLKPVEPGTTTQCGRANCSSNSAAGWEYRCNNCSVRFHFKCILRHSIQDIIALDTSNKHLYEIIDIFLHTVADASGLGSFCSVADLIFN